MSVKVTKSSVDFERPARGPHHCGECRHFLAPHGCEIVRGHINAADWCKRFRAKPEAQRRGVYDHETSERA